MFSRCRLTQEEPLLTGCDAPAGLRAWNRHILCSLPQENSLTLFRGQGEPAERGRVHPPMHGWGGQAVATSAAAGVVRNGRRTGSGQRLLPLRAVTSNLISRRFEGFAERQKQAPPPPFEHLLPRIALGV